MAGINTTISIMDRATETLRRIFRATEDVTDAMNQANRTTRNAFESSHAPELERDMLGAADAAAEITENTKSAADAVSRITEAINRASANTERLAGALEDATKNTRETGGAAEKLPEEYKNAADEADRLNDVMGKVLSTAMLIKGVGMAKE